MASPRAVLFVDGNNWYHALKHSGFRGAGSLNYAKLSRKLSGAGRTWIGTRFYIGLVNRHETSRLFDEQRQFVSRLLATDPKITAHFGRLETRIVDSPCAAELRSYLASLRIRIPVSVYHDLQKLAERHCNQRVTAEKAVDVHLAVDMVTMAERDEYDAAYLLSADGDFTPAVEAVRGLGKRVYVASPAKGGRLVAAATTYIHLKGNFFDDCR